MTTENPDTDAIEAGSPLAPTEQLTLKNGLDVKVQPLRMQGTLALLRIISRGAKDAIQNFNWDPSAAGFEEQLVAAILFAIPEAPMETLEFIQIMVRPAVLHEAPASGKLTPGNQSWNDDQWTLFEEAMIDPDLEDLLDIVLAIATREAPNLKALGKKLAAMIPMLRRSTEDPKSSSDSTQPKKPSVRSSARSTQKASSARSRQRTT